VAGWDRQPIRCGRIPQLLRQFQASGARQSEEMGKPVEHEGGTYRSGGGAGVSTGAAAFAEAIAMKNFCAEKAGSVAAVAGGV
jgi:hypothetical protein